MDEIRENTPENAILPSAGDSPDFSGDVILTGDQIGAFCDSLPPDQRFDITRLRTATRIARKPSLGEVEWRVTFGNRATVVVPITLGLV